jgi:hypothetical protein
MTRTEEKPFASFHRRELPLVEGGPRPAAFTENL